MPRAARMPNACQLADALDTKSVGREWVAPPAAAMPASLKRVPPLEQKGIVEFTHDIKHLWHGRPPV